jgi:hypothetical protein
MKTELLGGKIRGKIGFLGGKKRDTGGGKRNSLVMKWKWLDVSRIIFVRDLLFVPESCTRLLTFQFYSLAT